RDSELTSTIEFCSALMCFGLILQLMKKGKTLRSKKRYFLFDAFQCFCDFKASEIFNWKLRVAVTTSTPTSFLNDKNSYIQIWVIPLEWPKTLLLYLTCSTFPQIIDPA